MSFFDGIGLGLALAAPHGEIHDAPPELWWLLGFVDFGLEDWPDELKAMALSLTKEIAGLGVIGRIDEHDYVVQQHSIRRASPADAALPRLPNVWLDYVDALGEDDRRTFVGQSVRRGRGLRAEEKENFERVPPGWRRKRP